MEEEEAAVHRRPSHLAILVIPASNCLATTSRVFRIPGKPRGATGSP